MPAHQCPGERGGKAIELSRRSFLRAGLLLSGGSVFSGCLPEIRNLKSDRGDPHRVLIIGAGISGLAAAEILHSRGIRATVLEARGRLGGRIWTDRSLGFPVDLGAAWIEGIAGNPLTDLAKKCAMTTRVSDLDDAEVRTLQGKVLLDAKLAGIERNYEAVVDRLAKLNSTLQNDISVGRALRRVAGRDGLSAELKWWFTMEELNAAARLDRLSLKYSHSAQSFPGAEHLVVNGYDRIVHLLADGLDIRLGHPVRKVRHEREQVKVITDRGIFSGKAVLSTTPLGVLKAGFPRFSPDLPDWKKAAIQRLGFGVTNKVALRFPRAFWSATAEYIGCISPNVGEIPAFLNLAYHTGEPILVGFEGEGAPNSIERQSDERVVRRTIEMLRGMYGTEIPAPIGSIVTRWKSDPYARGAYSSISVGARPQDFDLLARPLGNTVFFAGEATHRNYPATVHGAYLSGRREARRIARQISLKGERK